MQEKIKVENGMDYSFFSAALHNYLPSLPTQRHQKTFADWQLNLYLSKLEPKSLHTLQHAVLINEPDKNLHHPMMICTYHMGSYRMINLWLIQREIKFAIVVGATAVNRERAEIEQINSLWGGVQKNKMEIINAEEAGSTFRMLRALKACTSLLFYIDGNTGTGMENAGNDNCCLINFLNQKIWARKGLAYLAHCTNTPILPVISYKSDWLSISLKFGNFIFPERERNTFAATTTQLLYDFLTPWIQKYPAQWEGWMHIHKIAWINTRNKKKSKNFKGKLVSFNNRSFGVFRLNSKAYLLQNNNYRIYPISGNVYKLLFRASIRPVAGKIFSPAHLLELSAADILRDA